MNISEIDLNEPVCMGFYKDSYVSLNTAKLLREVEFNVPVKKYITQYHEDNVHEEDGTSGPFGWKAGELEYGDGYFAINSDSDHSNEHYTTYPLPTQVIVQSWLRSLGIKVWVTPSKFSSAPNHWSYNVVMYEDGKLLMNIEDGGGWGLHFEEALEQGLQLVLLRKQPNNNNENNLLEQ